uniref:Biopolymer transporter ExbD n=1 Tax=Prevotella sp. GTC17260 TaxID=3236796 RepID=A0AB33JDU8_9BACT
MFSHRKHKVPELNTTSTADISFMLLIFFLVASSMDVSKGISHILPPMDKQTETIETSVDSKTLMALKVTAASQLLIDGKPADVGTLRQRVGDFLTTRKQKHLISLDVDPAANYNIYFNIQNELVAAYRIWRNRAAWRMYKKSYGQCSAEQKTQIRTLCPQRIVETEHAANAEKGAEP